MQGTRRSGVGTRTTPPTRKLIRKSASAKDIRHLSERVALERVLGLTTSNKNGLTCNPYSGIIAYPAGCVIVLFNSRTNAQSHIFNPEKKTLTALAFSSDGKYLASGESGHNPRVRVWEISDTFTQIAELAGHKFSINCVAFSPNLKYLVSVGDQHDMLVNIWNWRTGSKVACNKIGCKVRSVSFAENGSYFVTVGNRHVKYWYFDTEAGLKSSAPTPIAGRSGILGELRNNCFCDVGCGCGDNAANTYAVTKTGLLCSFNEKRVLDRWVELRSTGASSLTVNEKYIFCGCSDGIIRVFHPTTLHFISTLPKPHFLGVDVAAGLDASHMIAKDTNVRYPDVVSLALDDDSDKLTCVYNDHSLYVWDVHDVKKVGKACSFLYHSACIWGVETYPFMNDNEHPCLPVGSFLTCSSDDTIRVWNIDEGATLNSTFPKNIYSKELLKIIYTDEELTNIQDISSVPVSTSSDMKTGMRCLQVSPDGQLLAAGDRSGNLRVYDLQFVDQIMKIEAHEAEILCVEFSDPESGYRLLATSSRDRLIHIFDINKDFALVQTIDDHASSVTAVRFNYDQGVFQLLSCGADKHIMFHTSQEHEDGRDMTFVRANTIVVGKATMYDMDIEPTRKFATTCGQDRNVRVYDIQSVKQTQCYKGSISEEGTLIKIQLDPSGLYAATSCSDKSVNIYDFEAGDCTAVMYGHSELVTGLKFTQDGSRLISVSGDNCIFIWKLVPTLTQAIVLRLHELGKHLPGDLEIETDPMSALKNTFLLPKNGKDDLHCDTIEEEEFHQSDPKFFDQFEKDESRKLDYRFSVGRLPAWAKKQIIGKGEDSDDPGAVGVALPSGRWAQRVNEPPVMRSTSLGQTTLNSTSTMDNTTAIKDSQSTVSTESTLAIESITTIEDSVFKDGQPYSSHNKTRTKKDESVIYIPASQEEFDAEMQRSAAPKSANEKQPSQGKQEKKLDQRVETNKHDKTRGTLSSLNKIKSKILKKNVITDNNQSRSEGRRHSSVERPRKASIAHASSVTNLSQKSSPKARPKNSSRKQSIGERPSKGKLNNNSSSSSSPRQRRCSLPNLGLDKQQYKSKFSPSIKNSPRKNKLRESDEDGDGFEVHYVDYNESREIQREDSFKRSLKDEEVKEKKSKAFQVTARTSSKSRKVSDDLSKKTFYVEDKQSSTFVEPAVVEEPGVDSDSIEDEEDEELSDNDENLQSDTEPGIEDDSIQSPLEQHFEYLAGDSAAEGEGEEAFYVNAQNSSVDSKEKKTGFLSRCRSSISAKFLSRSQKSQPGKGSQSTEEQRKRLDSLKRIVDQNQNYGQVASRQPNTKEAKRMKKLSAKSEPNLSFGMPPPSKVTNRKSSGLRRTSGAAESHVDLRSIKDSQPDVSAKDRLRHLRGGSAGSLSPSELKSPSDIISMFNQRSSTPKTKQLSSPAKVTRTSKNSPGVSPVASPTRKAISSKFDEMELKLNNVNNIAAEQAVKRRPRRSGERPGMRHRPKSLVITPNSLDELIQINIPQAHSDTELDEPSESNTRKKKIANDNKSRRSLPASYQQNLETLSEAQPSVIMCDIQIDETVRNNSKKSLIDSTSSCADVTRTMISSRNDQTIVKRLSDVTEALEDKTVTGSVNVTREEAAPIVKHTSFPDEVKITVEEWNNRNSPPERDVPEMIEKEANNHEMELQKELLSEKLSDVCSIYEDEVTLTECNSAVEDFVKSFQEITCLQEKVLMQKVSHNRSKILKTLSTAYSSIADSLKQQKIKIDNNVQEVGKNGVIADGDVSKLLAAINDNHEQVEGKNAQTEKVIDILEHYSCAIVKLVEKKLKQDLIKEE